MKIIMMLLLMQSVASAETVQASYYTVRSSSAITASGEKFDENAQTCAHPSLPFGTILKVRNQRNGRWFYARVNDRGPARWTGRGIDLTPKGFWLLGVPQKQGVAEVEVEKIDT